MESKVVVITGASSGIGAALARNLGAKGHRVVLAARREGLLKQVAAESGTETLTVVTDVTRRADMEHLLDAAIGTFGHVDVWVNNAGRATGKTVMEITDDEFQSIIDVVLKSTLYGMQTIVPHFQERGHGLIINVSSTLGRVPFVTYRSVYSAAKSAVNILTANLRMDLMTKYPGIHVSLVLPGIVDTDFHRVAQTPMKMKAGERVGNAVVLSADEVAAQIASLLEKPVPELYIPAGAAEFAKQYYQDVAAFEARMAQR
ncbi:MAG: SDR family oxidoreductase [Thaumarchaeota archaeon]|nr:SDR family oxidoreductase [Nitrososphaerota archaeon]